MPVLGNIGLLATCAARGGQGELHAVRDAAVLWRGDSIVWAGAQAALPADLARGEPTWDARGALVIPGLVDAHTHLAFGGWRMEEIARRLAGESYLDIARAGGGIQSTVAETRRLDAAALLERCVAFAREMVALGVTTIECKSGYGLDLETELRILGVYRALARTGLIGVVPTYLGAHVVPPDRRDRRDAYVSEVIAALSPIAADGLARFCDVFVEEGAFSAAEARRIAGAARAVGLGLKLHVDQLNGGGGAELAAELGATSADHLDGVSERGVTALAAAGTVAVALPIAALYLQRPPAPARRLVDGGVRVAVATDFNPGTAPSFHLPLALTLACLNGGLTPAEALKGATIFAARACGVETQVGSIERGKRADLAVIDAPDVAHWLYHFRPNACLLTVRAGIVRWHAPSLDLQGGGAAGSGDAGGGGPEPS